MNVKHNCSSLNNRRLRKELLISMLCFPFFISCLWERPVKIKGIFTLPKLAEQLISNSGPVNVNQCGSKVPSDPTAVNISSSSSPLSVSVSWTNPKDCVPDSVTVVRKTGSVPSDKTDGTSIPVNSDKASFTDTNVSLNTMYYYRIFLGNRSGTYSKGTSVPVMAGSTSVVMAKIPDSSIVLDGTDSDSVWSNAPKISFSFPVLPTYADYTGGNDLNVTGYIRFAYDSSYLYIFYHTDDKYLRADTLGAPWLDDSLELYFDFNFTRSANTDSNHYCFIVSSQDGESLLGQGTGGSWTLWNYPAERTVYSVGSSFNNDADIDAGWNMEIRVPLSALGAASVTSGQVIGFTFFINDDDLLPFSTMDHPFPWTSGGNIYFPNSWGILQFQ